MKHEETWNDTPFRSLQIPSELCKNPSKRQGSPCCTIVTLVNQQLINMNQWFERKLSQKTRVESLESQESLESLESLSSALQEAAPNDTYAVWCWISRVSTRGSPARYFSGSCGRGPRNWRSWTHIPPALYVFEFGPDLQAHLPEVNRWASSPQHLLQWILQSLSLHLVCKSPELDCQWGKLHAQREVFLQCDEWQLGSPFLETTPRCDPQLDSPLLESPKFACHWCCRMRPQCPQDHPSEALARESMCTRGPQTKLSTQSSPSISLCHSAKSSRPREGIPQTMTHTKVKQSGRTSQADSKRNGSNPEIQKHQKKRPMSNWPGLRCAPVRNSQQIVESGSLEHLGNILESKLDGSTDQKMTAGTHLPEAVGLPALHTTRSRHGRSPCDARHLLEISRWKALKPRCDAGGLSGQWWSMCPKTCNKATKSELWRRPRLGAAAYGSQLQLDTVVLCTGRVLLGYSGYSCGRFREVRGLSQAGQEL